jgi:hypothetical protein
MMKLFVMSSESLALSEVDWVETSLIIVQITVRDSSTPLGMT